MYFSDCRYIITLSIEQLGVEEMSTGQELSNKFSTLAYIFAPSINSTFNFDDHDSQHYAYNALKAISKTAFCGRCGGSGRYGPTQVYAGTCFKCNGSGVTKLGMKFSELESTVKKDPSLITKWIERKLKAEARADARREEKRQAMMAAVKVNQEECLSTLSPEDRQIVELAFSRDEQEPTNPFITDVHSKFKNYGVLSEKQLAAVVNAVKRDTARAEMLKSARKFIAGDFYDDVIATVAKIEEESYSITPWASGITNKISLNGPSGERIIVKTNSNKLMEKFEASRDGNTPIKLIGNCKWVAPEGNVAVFTARGMKVFAAA